VKRAGLSIFRDTAGEIGGWARPARLARGFGVPGLSAGFRQARKSRCYTAFTRRAVLPVCDAFGLLLAALPMVGGLLAAGYAAAVLIFLGSSGQHRLRICMRVSDQIPRLAVAVVLPIPLFLLWIGSGRLVRLAALSVGVLLILRFALYAALRVANRHKWLTEPALIIGTGKLAVKIGEVLREHSELGMRPVGFIDSLDAAPESSLPVLGEISELSDVAAKHDVRRIIVTFPEDGDEALVSVLRADHQLAAEVCVVPRMYELAAAIPASCQDELWGIPLILVRHPGLGPAGRAIKRSFDVVVGTVLLIVLAPVLLILMSGILLSCGRPVLFRQVRVGRSGQDVKITKLRTVVGADRDGRWAVSPEDCSALGRWLRASHLDELPQLLNVIRGEMSLVGPRPERRYFTSKFAEIVPRYGDRHRVCGGLTGLAQVHGLTGDTSIHERARFDNHYIEHWSLWLDLVILVRTLTEPLTGIRKYKRAGGVGSSSASDHSAYGQEASNRETELSRQVNNELTFGVAILALNSEKLRIGTR
jgi:exopolysaccharide biosynthesis polyprenyl glycosylphosphotransferase